MDDVWRGPKWFRNVSLDERLKNARIPNKLPLDVDLTRVLTLREWVEQPDDLLVLQCANTYTAAGYAATLLGQMIQDQGLSGRWVVATRYIEMITDAFDGGLGEEYESTHLLKYLRGTFDVVVLDGLGEEYNRSGLDGATFAQNALGDLIKTRFEKGLVTIVTTPCDPLSLSSKYGSRVGAYVAEGTVVQLGR